MRIVEDKFDEYIEYLAYLYSLIEEDPVLDRMYSKHDLSRGFDDKIVDKIYLALKQRD